MVLLVIRRLVEGVTLRRDDRTAAADDGEEHVVDDRVVEALWRAAISMTNKTRRPRALPLFAERATVKAGRRVYLSSVYLDADAIEVTQATSRWRASSSFFR
ncbi:hypothetical protein [Microbacterium allomyrinae]|uniref:Uncharacterized protein n=1 Tax=Microbacterium allomyrinae TaxID=2830666 RepID=A0A9X1S431_9MICO|nr:hypothetical protein [Microbacterium allomyrinae]MCC2032610.1 hypothetical protein [Microbacterium allomyrinae]